MKTLVFTYILLCFYSCRENSKQPPEVIAKPGIITNDTFMLNLASQKDRTLDVPEGIEFDNVEKKIKNGKIIQKIEIPRLTQGNLKHAENVLRNRIMEASNRFLADQVYNRDKEYSQDLKEGEIYIWPVMIYKDQKIINYCFELFYSDNILVRSYNEYYSLSYDLTKNKLITAASFFKTKTTDDSLHLSNLILRGFDPPIRNEFNFVEIDFSMDDSVIYFFTDQYQLGIPFNHSCGIKKKYLAGFIKEEYK